MDLKDDMNVRVLCTKEPARLLRTYLSMRPDSRGGRATSESGVSLLVGQSVGACPDDAALASELG